MTVPSACLTGRRRGNEAKDFPSTLAWAGAGFAESGTYSRPGGMGRVGARLRMARALARALVELAQAK